MNDETMLPCPFCGGEAAAYGPTCNKYTPYNPTDRAFPLVRCKSCYATANGKDWDDTRKSAIERWNTRARASAPECSTNRDEISSKLVDAPDGGEPVAWLIDWPDERDLGHYFAEEPNENARSAPLYTRSNAKVGEVCAWTQDEDDGSWDTACGNKHEFTADGPEENEHKFCPYCGNTLTTHDKTKA